MEFTLEYRLEISLHRLARYLYHIRNALLAAFRHFINIRSNDLDLVVFHFGSILRLYQLEAVHTGAVELYLHIAAADNFALKCGSKSNRNIDMCNFNLNVACFQGGRIELAYIRLHDQALRNLDIYCLCGCHIVGNYREAECNSTCAACNNNRVKRSECVYKRRHTLHGVFHQAGSVAALDVAEDQCCTHCNGYYMNNTGHILAKRDYTHVCTGLVAKLFTLVDNAANQRNKDTLRLIGFYQIHTFLCGRSGAQDNCNARDIAGYKRNAELTDNRIAQMSIARSLVRSCAVDIFQRFNKLRAECRSNTGHKYIVQTCFSGHKRFYNSKSSLHITEVRNLCSCYAKVTRQAVRSVRKSNCLIRAVLCDSCVDSIFCQSIHSIVSTKYNIK